MKISGENITINKLELNNKLFYKYEQHEQSNIGEAASDAILLNV